MGVFRKLLWVAVVGGLVTGGAYVVSPALVSGLGGRVAELAGRWSGDGAPSADDLPGAVKDTLPEEVAGSGIYRWRGEHGRWVYGDDPPEGVDAEPVREGIGDENIVPGIAGGGSDREN